MSLFSKFFAVCETRLVPPRLSLLRTLYFNFRVLPFKQALKLPVYIYGKVHFPLLAGSVEICDNIIRKGMVKIGRQDPFAVDSSSSFVSIAPMGKIIFKGPANISTNSALRVFNDGVLTIGRCVLFGSGVKAICNGGTITIGDYTRIAYNTNIVNSGFHSVVDLTTLKVGNHIRPIAIGTRCWIGNSSTINGGAKLKDATIVGTGSLVNKDFSKLEEENQMIGGRPAKLIKPGLARVFNPQIEKEIMLYFKNNPSVTTYVLKEFADEDMTILEQEEFK